jgi:hypothetical protein
MMSKKWRKKMAEWKVYYKEKSMITYPNIPTEWEQVRRDISKMFDKTAILAGGAIRDHLLSIPYNDLDVFILDAPFHWKKTSGEDYIAINGSAIQAEAFLNRFGIKLHSIDDEDLYSSHFHVDFNGFDVDLVFSWPSSVDAVLDRFDVGLCKVAWDGIDYTITSDFERDAKNKTLTIMPDKPAFADHKQRLEKKFLPRGYSWRFCIEEGANA